MTILEQRYMERLPTLLKENTRVVEENNRLLRFLIALLEKVYNYGEKSKGGDTAENTELPKE